MNTVSIFMDGELYLRNPGVSYKSGPSWVQDKIMPYAKMNQQYEDGRDFGHDVPISAYSIEELRSVVRCSLDIFKRYDFRRPKSFRAGGWMYRRCP